MCYYVQMASELLSRKRRKVVCSKPSLNVIEPRSLNELPQEILLKIFSHFGPEDLALNICKVCQLWKDIAEDVALWKALSYRCYKYSDIRRVKEVLTVAPALDSLIVHNRKCVARILKFLSHGCTYLRKLLLSDCYLGKDGTGLLKNIVTLYPDLEVLSLEGCHKITSAGYRHIASLKKLSELDLSYTKGLSGKTVRLIAESCQHLKKLSLLTVTQIDDNDVIHVIKKLGKQLTTLALDAENLTDVAYLYLKNCTRLQELEFTFCENMTDRGLLEGIGSLHELTSLSLSMGDNLTTEALSTFLHGPSVTYIVSLELNNCSNLGDEGLSGIAERCIHLKKLAVCMCSNVSDAGISMVIIQYNQLRVLDLTGLSITGEGWLALVPLHLTHLRELILVACDNLHGEYVEELMVALPELDVSR